MNHSSIFTRLACDIYGFKFDFIASCPHFTIDYIITSIALNLYIVICLQIDYIFTVGVVAFIPIQVESDWLPLNRSALGLHILIFKNRTEM